MSVKFIFIFNINLIMVRDAIPCEINSLKITLTSYMAKALLCFGKCSM